MIYLCFIFLSTEVVKAVVPPTSNSHDWLPTIGAVLISIVTGLFSWWKSRPKGRNDQFKTFMDESAEFRDEIRKERENLKQELTLVHNEKRNLQQKIVEYEEVIDKCTRTASKYKNEIEGVKAQLTLLLDAKNYKEIVNNLPLIVWVSDPDGKVNFYNARAYEFGGVPFNSANELKYVDFFHPDDVQKYIKNWTEAKETGKKYFCEYRLKRSDGMYRWTISIALPIVQSDGAIKEWVGVSIDIHDYKMKMLEECKKRHKIIK